VWLSAHKLLAKSSVRYSTDRDEFVGHDPSCSAELAPKLLLDSPIALAKTGLQALPVAGGGVLPLPVRQPVESDRMPDLIAAFSSAENAAEFTVSRGETE
jgi:hypothetical protein